MVDVSLIYEHPPSAACYYKMHCSPISVLLFIHALMPSLLSMTSTSPFFLSLILALLLTLVTAVDPVVDVSYSRYKGKDNGNGVTSWLGMRYAAPPIGDLSFMPPQDPTRSRQVKDTRKFKLKCVDLQARPSLIGKSQSEDCLFINVFAPTDAARMARLPVY
ncbi:unnamed protein product, partial [Fusarium graminearum]